MELVAFPSTEAEFRACFAEEAQCRAYLAQLRWPGGFRCAHCGGQAAYFLRSKRVVYECAGCGRQVSLIAGTIFEQSKKPLALWFRAIFDVTASKQGISAAELQRKLGLGSYQTAWSWLQKIRTATVRPNREPLSGEVEIDESYLGGPKPGKPGRGAEEKAIVAGAVEKRGRGCGRVRLGLLANVSASALIGFVQSHLDRGESAHTDGWRGYAKLGKKGYQHIVSVLSRLDQTAAEVLPRVHLIFSLLKRWILGTHQGSVSLKHLQGYLEEFAFRFNRRHARRITHGAERLLGIVIVTPPRPFWKIVGRSRPQAKARLTAPA
jgi:transposase-like protein